MDRYFAEILADLSGEVAFKKRNKQQKLAGYLKVHPYKQNEVAIIGDSSEEIEIGKKLGILSIAITDGYYATARLKAFEPNFLVYNLGEVKKIICP